MSRDKSEIEVPSWRYDIDLLYEDEKPEYAQTLDDSRKHLQDFADARSDKYLSVKRMIRMGHRLLADNPGLDRPRRIATCVAVAASQMRGT